MRLASTCELLGIEDCIIGTRMRTTSLRCNSQSGELLEILYTDLINCVKKVESSCIFLENFVVTRDKEREELIRYGKVRHCLAESMEIRTSRETNPSKLYNYRNDAKFNLIKIGTTKNNIPGYSPSTTTNISSLNNIRTMAMLEFNELKENQRSGKGPYKNTFRFIEPIKIKDLCKNTIRRKCNSFNSKETMSLKKLSGNPLY